MAEGPSLFQHRHTSAKHGMVGFKSPGFRSLAERNDDDDHVLYVMSCSKLKGDFTNGQTPGKRGTLPSSRGTREGGGEGGDTSVVDKFTSAQL